MPDYVVVQAREAITNEDEFAAARALCDDACGFAPDKAGDRLTLEVTDLSPTTRYHYAVRAKDEGGNLSAFDGASGAAAKVRTRKDTIAPGRVRAIRAKPASRRAIRLVFAAAASDRRAGPAVARYVVVQSRRPIRSARHFKRATTLCGRFCSFSPRAAGERLKLTITDLRRATTYHYAIRALDEAGNKGKRSKSVRVLAVTRNSGMAATRTPGSWPRESWLAVTRPPDERA